MSQSNADGAYGPDIEAGRDGQASVDVQRFPIVVLPGIMGSRVESGGTKIWDPDDTSFMLGLASNWSETTRKAMDPSINPGTVIRQPYDWWSDGDFFDQIPADQQDEMIRRGWGGASWDFYGFGLREIEAEFESVGGVTYCFAYDWRASNRVNGGRLNTFLAEIVKGQDAHELKPIIVTHSMGGLVTRAAISQGGGGLMSAVVHTFMPTFGAPEAYAKMRLGDSGVFGAIVGNTPDRIVHKSCGTPTAFELMPSQRYPDFDNDWLVYNDNVDDHADADNAPYSLTRPWDIYLDETGMIGVTRKDKWTGDLEVVWQSTKKNIEASREFHTGSLNNGGRGFHPHTFNLVGDGHANTTNSASLAWAKDWLGRDKTDPNESECTRHKSSAGDGTVALPTAEAANPYSLAHDSVNGVEHAKAFGNPEAIKKTIELIRLARAYLEPWAGPGGGDPGDGDDGDDGDDDPDVRHFEYTIVSGDTLSGIAMRYGTTYQDLWAYSGDPDTGKPNSERLRSGDWDLIYPGEVILVPKP